MTLRFSRASVACVTLLYRPLQRRGASSLVMVMASLGVMIVSDNLLVLAFGPSAPPELLARYGPVAVWGQEFLFLLNTEQTPTISIDEQPPLPMTPIGGTSYWYRLETLRLGTTHNFMNWALGSSAIGLVKVTVCTVGSVNFNCS
jgi:hypothetical protein